MSAADSHDDFHDVEPFSRVFENDAVGMALIEAPSGRFRRVNAALCRLSGYTEDELLDLTAADLSDADDVSLQHTNILETVSAGSSMRATRRCRRKNGEWRQVAFTVTPFADDVGFLVIEDLTAHYEAQEALRASKDRSRDVYVNSPIAMCVTEPEVRFISVNPAMCQMFGYTEQEFLALETEALLHPDELGEQATANVAERPGGQSARSAERHCVRKDGSDFRISATWSHFTDAAGNPRAFAVVYDITAQHEAETVLRTSEQLYRELFVNSPIPIAIREPAVRFHAANPAFCRMLGYTEEELRELEPPDVSHPDDFERQRRPIGEALRKGEPFEFERRFIAKDGRTVIGRCRAANLHTDNEGRPLAIVAVEDVTELRRSEDERSRLASIVASSGDAVVAVNRDFLITDWNAAAETLFGYAADEITGQPLDVLCPLDLRDEARTAVTSILDGRRVEHLRTSRLHKNGQAIAVDISVSPVVDSAGAIVGAAAMLRSVEAQLRAEAMFRREQRSAGEVVEPRNVVRVAGALSTAMGILVLAGWALGVDALKGLAPSLVTMKPLTAVCFVLMGVALMCSGAKGRMRRVALGAAAATLLIAGVALLEYAIGRDIGTDRLLFARELGGGPHPGRMAVATALVLSALALAIFALAARRPLVAQGLGIGAFVVSGTALLGYLYGVHSLYSTGPYSTMALHTALGLLAVSLGVLVAIPDGLLPRMLNPGTGGELLRRTTIIAIVAMTAVGGARVVGQKVGFYDTTFGVAIMVVAAGVIIVAVASRTARTVDRFDQDLLRAGEELIRANEQLEARVADRTAQLERSEQRFRALVESAPDPMICVAADGRIVIANAQAERLFGYSRAQLVGQPVEMLVPDAARAAHPDHRAVYLAEPHARPMGAGVQLTARRRDGTEFPAEISLSIWSDDRVMVCAAVRDVTEQRDAALRLAAANRELNLRARELDRSNHDLEEFAYVASHDLKEPLRAVRGFSQLLVRDYKGRLDGQADEYLDFVNDGASRMQSLIDDLLTYSRIGADTTPRAFPLRSAVDDALANLNSGAADARIDIDPLPTVLADPAQVTQLMQNLIGNALKFRGESTPIVRVSAEVAGDDWIVSVADNGIGIDSRFADQIFTVFQRLHGRNEYAGTGVGLAICKRVVERWGGRIWIESEPEKGATFRFTIPGGST